jgi:uncharacterized protein
LFNQHALNEVLTRGKPAVPSSATPAEVLASRADLILTGDADGYADLFASDGVIELPFAPPGVPGRLEGREAIRQYSRQVTALPLRFDVIGEPCLRV